MHKKLSSWHRNSFPFYSWWQILSVVVIFMTYGTTSKIFLMIEQVKQLKKFGSFVPPPHPSVNRVTKWPILGRIKCYKSAANSFVHIVFPFLTWNFAMSSAVFSRIFTQIEDLVVENIVDRPMKKYAKNIVNRWQKGKMRQKRKKNESENRGGGKI